MTNSLGAQVRIGAARSVKFTGSRQLLETSNNVSGRFKRYIAGMVDQTLSVSGLMGYSNGSQYDYTSLYEKLVAIGTNEITFAFKEDNGTYVNTYTGQCIVKNFERSRNYNDAGMYDVELQVNGEVTVSSTGSYVPYYWYASSSPLTDAAFVALIEAGTATGVSGPSYSTISINFAAPGGKYLYFAIPASSPDRLSYYVNVGDSGRIGQPGDLFNYNTLPVTIGSGPSINYKIYSSNISKANNSPMDLRTFYPTSSGVIGYGTTIYYEYTCSGSEGKTVTITGAIGVPVNKIIVILRGGQSIIKIATSGSPVVDGAVWNLSTGELTFYNDVVIDEKITLICLS